MIMPLLLTAARDFPADPWSGAHGGFRGLRAYPARKMSETGLTVPDMNEPLSRYNMTVTVGGDGGHLPDPAKFAAAADQAAWAGPRTSSARTSPKIISVITVTAPDRYAAVAVAKAVVSDALKRQALSSSQPEDDRAQHRTEPAA